MTINIFFQQKSRYKLIAKMILLNSKQILIQRFPISYRRGIVNFRNKNSAKIIPIRLIIIAAKKRITESLNIVSTSIIQLIRYFISRVDAD